MIPKEKISSFISTLVGIAVIADEVASQSMDNIHRGQLHKALADLKMLRQEIDNYKAWCEDNLNV